MVCLHSCVCVCVFGNLPPLGARACDVEGSCEKGKQGLGHRLEKGAGAAEEGSRKTDWFGGQVRVGADIGIGGDSAS